jgi:UrcA family protein
MVMDHRKARVTTSLKYTVIALACLGGIAPVLASAAEAHQVTVKYDDLNLDSRDDAARLLARIRLAARRVCGEESARLDLQHAWRVCYDGSITAAVTTVGSPVLTALARGGHYAGATALNR